MADNNANLSRAAGIMSIASAISRATGLVSTLIIATALEFTRFQDSYNLANIMPNMLFELIAGGILTSIFIPILVEKRLEGEEAGWRLASNITNITIVFLTAVALFCTIFSFYLVRLQTFLVPTHQVSISELNFLFKVFIWQIVFYGLTAIFNGILQVHRRFAAPAYAPIFNNLVVIAVVLLLYLPLKNSDPNLSRWFLALGTTLGIAAMAIVQIPALLRAGWKHYFIIDLRDPAIKKLAILSLPIIGYVLSNQIGLTFSNALAWKFKGGMTAFMIAWKFFQMPHGLLAVSISTVLFPGLAEYAASKDMFGFKKHLQKGVMATAFILLPTSFLLFILSRPIISVFLMQYGPDAVAQIAAVMAYFMVGLLPFSVFMLMNRVFYSLKDSRTPLMVNAIGVPLNIGLNFLLVGYYGVAGLSMGHSLTYLFTVSLMFIALRRKIGPLGVSLMAKRVIKFMLTSAGAAVIMLLLRNWALGLDLDGRLAEVLAILLVSVVGGGLYILLSVLTRTEEVQFLNRMFKGILRGEPGTDVK